VPPQYQGACDIDAGVGARDDTDEEGEGKVVDFTTTKDEEGECGEKHGAGGNDGSAQGLVERLVHDFPEGAADAQFEVFTNPVEDDDGVVGRETDDGQDRGDGSGAELFVGDNKCRSS